MLAVMPRTVVLLVGLAGATAGSVGAQETHELVRHLQGGGYVLAFRHTHTDRSRQDRQVDYSDRETQRNLSQRGIEQAREIGAAIRALDIPIGEIYTSPFFRTVDTATEAFGSATVEPELSSRNRSSERRVELFTAPPPAGTNRVLISHQGVLRGIIPGLRGVSLEEGDIVVLRPTGEGSLEMVSLIRVDEWQNLLARR
jgi:broad specificity phosphatase PhoE